MDPLFGGLVVTLILGSYVFTGWVFRYFNARIEKLVANHPHEIDQRLTTLEKHDG